MKRFYKTVAVAQGPEGWCVLLDGKPVRTPAGNALRLPTAALAEAIAVEWRGQGETIVPAGMALQRLANTALDGVAAHRAEVIVAILRLGQHDLLCYRAEAPAALAAAQADAWDPLLDWAARDLGARLVTTTGIGSIDQPAAAMAALAAAVAAESDFALAALHVLASITGSLVLGLAVVGGVRTAPQSFELSRLDEAHQIAVWGTDSEAQVRAAALAREMDVAAAFLAAART